MAHGFMCTETLLSGMIFQVLIGYFPDISQEPALCLEYTGFEHPKPAINLLRHS